MVACIFLSLLSDSDTSRFCFHRRVGLVIQVCAKDADLYLMAKWRTFRAAKEDNANIHCV